MAENERIGNLKLRGQAALSTALHLAPFPWAVDLARHKTKLTGPTDDLLHWRLGRVKKPSLQTMSDAWWARFSGTPGAISDPATWRDVILTARRESVDDILSYGLRPAVAYRHDSDSPVMVGTQELGAVDRRGADFLMPVDREGKPDRGGWYMGVATRVGQGAVEMAIGGASRDGKYFMPIGTFAVDGLVELPESLRRV